ncbi:dynamin family protein [Thalassovita sp.]|uniref:dynamin family protein n=1 Tax=Thalassovita sp. TaxID=1979401 RepID=UPI0029DE58A5|nr:dynamin family protein [Thalassovita sp.]
MNITTDFKPAIELHGRSGPTNLRAGSAALTQCAQQIAALEEHLDLLEQVADEGALRSIKRLRARLDEFEPTVTILGQVKSGKTTLINALAGWSDLLPSDVNPLTSVVTSLHLTPGRAKRDFGAVFRFMTEEEWASLLSKGGRMGELAGRAGAETELERLRQQVEAMQAKSKARLGRNFELLMGQEHRYEYFDKNLLERYICLGDDFGLDDGDTSREQGRFADITRTAELHLNCPTLPLPMCLRDTPGVNDTFMVREQITLQALRSSRLCVVVLSAGQALTSVDMGLIRLISNLKSRDVIFFVNRIDELRDPATEVPEIEQSIRATLKAHDSPTDVSIVFGSAEWGNRALSGDIENMGKAGSAALLNWAKAQLTTCDAEQSPADMVWNLSGIPQLLSAISDRVTKLVAEPFIADIASSAITIATTQQAAERIVRVQGFENHALLPVDEIQRRFNRIERENTQRLERDLTGHVDDFNLQADRAHGKFVDRATQALVQHLLEKGEKVVWEYDPSGLRVLLRSAYSRLAMRTRSVAAKHYQNAIQDIAELLYAGFGDSVEGIRIAIPEVPKAPPPVALGQTIALDFDNGWWVNWWRRRRGYDAFAEQFRSLINTETETFITHVKSEQVTEVRDAIRQRLSAEIEHYRNLVSDLLSRKTPDVASAGLLGQERDRRAALMEQVVNALEPMAQQSQKEAS